MVNLNNGGVSPSPRVVTEALVRYIWQQEDATAYTMWQILEPQSETIRTGLAELFGCDREEVAITRNTSDSLEALLFGFDLKPGDEVLTTTQDYPRMLTTLRQRERREGIVLKTVRVPVPPKDPSEITAAYEAAFTPRTRLVLVSHVLNLTGQITPVRRHLRVRAQARSRDHRGRRALLRALRVQARRPGLRLLRHVAPQVAPRAQGHGDALRPPRQDKEGLAAARGRRVYGRGHTKVRGDGHALRRAAARHRRGPTLPPGRRPRAQGGATPLCSRATG